MVSLCELIVLRALSATPAGSASFLLSVSHRECPTLGAGVNMSGARVLELGCGAALPAIAAAHCGAAELLLQDYNASVVSFVTAPTVNANRVSVPARYFHGDWCAPRVLQWYLVLLQ
jgi:predicted RNA methylase